MIAGETQMILAEHLGDDIYDDFLFGSKEKRAKRKAARKARRVLRRNQPKRIERREKKKQFFSKLGQAYRDLGGGTAIGGALDTLITKPTVATAMANGTPSDFQLDLASDTDKDKAKSMDTLLIVGGAVVVASVIGVIIYQSQKGKYVKINQN